MIVRLVIAQESLGYSKNIVLVIYAALLNQQEVCAKAVHIDVPKD